MSLILGTRFSLILGTRWQFSLILGTRFSILGTRIGYLKRLKKNCYKWTCPSCPAQLFVFSLWLWLVKVNRFKFSVNSTSCPPYICTKISFKSKSFNPLSLIYNLLDVWSSHSVLWGNLLSDDPTYSPNTTDEFPGILSFIFCHVNTNVGSARPGFQK